MYESHARDGGSVVRRAEMKGKRRKTKVKV